MNTSDYTYIVNKPGAIRGKHSQLLERIVDEFPYFQSARALHLKDLYNQDSFKYNQALKTTAAYTTDRSVLFDFITSGQFTGIQQAFLDEKQARINEIMVNGSEIIVAEKAESNVNSLEQSILTSIKGATPEILAQEKAEPINFETVENASELAEQKLEIGKPLEFSRDEKHSFQEWLKLANFKPIEREEIIPEAEPVLDDEKQKKLDLIDKFIEANPKIISAKDAPPPTYISVSNQEDTSYLMTETLAKVYLEQKKYQKAIQAYEILILKYPEKSSLFADRISDIRILQQNN